MTIKEIYKRAKKINPLYTNSFEDFISDFEIAEIVFLNLGKNSKSIE